MDQVKFGKDFLKGNDLGKSNQEFESVKEPRDVDKPRKNRTDDVGSKRPGTLRQQKKK